MLFRHACENLPAVLACGLHGEQLAGCVVADEHPRFTSSPKDGSYMVLSRLADRIDTSEFFQQTIFTSGNSEPRVKVRSLACCVRYTGAQV